MPVTARTGLIIVLLCLEGAVSSLAAEPGLVLREMRRLEAPEAHQAVAVGPTSLIAISNRTLAKYDKATGKLVKRWDATKASPIVHLNSGLVHEGLLYCANSNWPRTPRENFVEIFDADTLEPRDRRQFPEQEAAINWIERYQGSWWIVFAHYGDDVGKTRLVRYDDQWESTGQWTFPASVTKRFRPHSNSGGAFGPNGRLYVTGHDHAELYLLNSPSGDQGELEHVATVPAPIAGQGIAWDRSDIGMLYGIVRKTHEVVAMRLSHAAEYQSLKEPVEWVRDKNNPVIPPRAAHFDSHRCMNPWAIRTGDTYRVFYSGGDARGKQRIGYASAKVDELQKWEREGPLFTGQPGQFDAAWCVLPHVVSFGKTWHLYYTGNAGRGSGLSAFPGIGLATAFEATTDTWHRRSKPVLTPSNESGAPDAIGIAGGSVLQVPGDDKPWRFYYTGCPTIGKPLALNQQKTICLAVSRDGVHWEKRGALMLRDPSRDYENIGVAGPVVHRKDDGTFRMWYSAIGTRWGYYSICYAESDDGIHWRRGAKSGENLQLTPQGDGWEGQMVEYPSVIQEGARLRLFYCGNGYGRTGIGTAVSK